MSLCKAGLGIHPDLVERSLQNPDCLWWAALKPALKRLPTFRSPPALSPLYFLRPFNDHFEHSISESYFALFVSPGAHKWPQLWEIKSKWGKGSLLQRNTCSDCRLGSGQSKQKEASFSRAHRLWNFLKVRAGLLLQRLLYPIAVAASANTNILASWLS